VGPPPQAGSPRPNQVNTQPRAAKTSPAPVRPAPPGGNQLLHPERALTTQELQEMRDMVATRYKIPAPDIDSFVVYQSRAEYEEVYRRLHPDRKGSIPNGFNRRGKIHFPPGADVHTMVHETLHSIGRRNAVRNKLGGFMNEGLTDWMVRRKLGERTGKRVYEKNVAFVRELAAHIGEEPLEIAFLHGQWDDLRRAMIRQAGGMERNVDIAYGWLTGIGAKGQNIGRLQDVRRLLRMNVQQ